VQIAKLLWMEAFIGMDFAKQASRFEPIVFGWCQDRMVASKSLDKLPLGRLGCPTAQLREYYC